MVTENKPKQTKISKAIHSGLLKRLPSTIQICNGCYGIEKTLTTRDHYEQVWTKDGIKVVEEINGSETTSHVELRCQFCANWRKLALTEVSFNFFLDSWNNGFELFTLVKDFPDPKKKKYFVILVGFKTDKKLDLTEWHE